MLFVTDPGLRALGLCDAGVASLQAAGASVAIFDAVEADPSRATLMQAVEAGRAAGVTGVVGFGGGSSLDVAKLAALLLGSGEDLDAAWGVGQAKGPRLPLALVPTTAGTGSEVTPVSIITVGEEEKRGVSSPVILPDIAVLDAELTLGLPPAITAATGIDAMVHAIEAYASKSANNNPLSKMLARQALRLLGANIETAVFDGGDTRGARRRCCSARCSPARLSPIRRSRPCMRWPIRSAARSMCRTACPTRWCCRMCCASTRPRPRISMPRSPPTLSRSWRAKRAPGRCAAFIEALAALGGRLGLQPRLREVGIGREHLPKMAADAMKQQRLLVNNPRPVEEADALGDLQGGVVMAEKRCAELRRPRRSAYRRSARSRPAGWTTTSTGT